jgi:hypothetical protein
VGRDEIRLPAVRGVLSRLHEYADRDRLAELTGTVRIDLTRDDARLGHHLLRIGSGSITVEADVPATAASDVVLGTSVIGSTRPPSTPWTWPAPWRGCRPSTCAR